MSNTKTEAQRLADELRSHVQTYPQMSEDEPGGYCSQDDQLMDEAATELLSLDAQNKAMHKIIDQLRAQVDQMQGGEPVTLTDEGNRALQVMRWIDSGEWTLTKSRPSSLLTDEANAERAWFVERQAEPYCDNKGNRRWFGCTAFEAFTIAIAALSEKGALR